MTASTYGRKAVRVFFLLTVILSGVCETLIAVRHIDLLYALLMWIPALSAAIGICVSLRERGERLTASAFFRGIGFRKCRFRCILLGCALPLVYITVPYLLFWLIEPQSLVTYATNLPGALLSILFAMVTGTLINLLSAAGEEIGWRGFMVPALAERLGERRTLLLSSLIWCVWHLPLLLFDDYMAGAPLWYKLPAFLLCIFPIGLMAGVLALETGSFYPAAFLHAAHNNFDQGIFGLLTVSERKMYFVSETGIFTVVLAWTLALWMLCRYRRSSVVVKGNGSFPA